MTQEEGGVKMRPKRDVIEGATYHVTSRTNGKKDAFFEKLGQRILLHVITEAKEKYEFQLHNFCIMPNHLHLLITPKNGTNISRIMQWIKTNSAKIWNSLNYSKDHFWGERFFSRPIKDMDEYINVFNYIDQNPVKAGLVSNPIDWIASGAYYAANKSTLIDP